METLKDLRKQAGLSAKEVAERLGVSAPTIYHYENGECYVSIDRIIPLAELYGASEREIIIASLQSKVGQSK